MTISKEQALESLEYLSQHRASGFLWRDREDTLRAYIEQQAARIAAQDDALMREREARHVIALSVASALERAGVSDCDDPGDAIDVLADRIAELERPAMEPRPSDISVEQATQEAIAKNAPALSALAAVGRDAHGNFVQVTAYDHSIPTTVTSSDAVQSSGAQGEPEDRSARIAAALAVVQQVYPPNCAPMASRREYVEDAIKQLIDAGYAVHPAPAQQPIGHVALCEDGSVCYEYFTQSADGIEHALRNDGWESMTVAPVFLGAAPAQQPAVPEGWRIARKGDCVRVISPDGSTIDVLDDARDPAELMLRDLADALLSAQPSQTLRQEAPETAAESQNSPELSDAERYRAWRDAMVRNCPEFIRRVEGSLPDAVAAMDRRPTADEWDMAIDAAVDSLRAQAADGEGQ